MLCLMRWGTCVKTISNIGEISVRAFNISIASLSTQVPATISYNQVSL